LIKRTNEITKIPRAKNFSFVICFLSELKLEKRRFCVFKGNHFEIRTSKLYTTCVYCAKNFTSITQQSEWNFICTFVSAHWCSFLQRRMKFHKTFSEIGVFLSVLTAKQQSLLYLSFLITNLHQIKKLFFFVSFYTTKIFTKRIHFAL
jgi:hypothetical protein